MDWLRNYNQKRTFWRDILLILNLYSFIISNKSKNTNIFMLFISQAIEAIFGGRDFGGLLSGLSHI